MPILGFDSVSDMFDGGGAGRSGSTYSFEGSAFDRDRVNNYVDPGGNRGGSSGISLSTIAAGLGFLAGGPSGAAIGAGIGSLLEGKGVGGALSSGAGTYLTGALGGNAGTIADILSGGSVSQGAGSALASLIPTLQQKQDGMAGRGAEGSQPPSGGLGGLLGAFDNPLMIAALLKATEPKNVTITSPEQRRQLQTGERLPDYRGTPAFDYRYARGGFVKGPGTATSDSIPARIYQGGRPVQEARLSDGEFVMTNRAVRGAGNGNRGKGAAEMYRMMRQLERRA